MSVDGVDQSKKKKTHHDEDEVCIACALCQRFPPSVFLIYVYSAVLQSPIYVVVAKDVVLTRL